MNAPRKIPTPVLNPAEAYTEAEWDNLDPETRSELETQYVLNNPILMKQILCGEEGEWFTVTPAQLGLEMSD